MNRVTKRDLEFGVQLLNQVKGQKAEPYTRGDDGKYYANVGTYLLDGAYSGWQLARMDNESGGQRTISSGGYISKSELYHQIQTLLNVHWNEKE